jgi:uncharacterized SAM-binding protein YcdF (DUF218 family)
MAFSCVIRAAHDDERQTADAIVVLGAAHYNGRPSPVLRARLDHAYQLYTTGRAVRIIVTGGTAQGDTVSEAVVGRRYLHSLSVPEDMIIVLPQGHSTVSSMTAVAAWLGERRMRSVLLVSDRFHMCRLRLEARRAALVAFTSPAADSPIAPGSRQEWFFFATEAFKVPIAWLRAVT